MTLSGLALTLDVFFQEQVVAVVDGIGELVDPVAQNQQARVAFQLHVQLDVAVAEDEEVDFGMVGHVVAGKAHEVLLLLTREDGRVGLLVADITMLRPRHAECDAPPGMQGGEQPLAEPVVEDGTDELERRVGVAQSVAVGQEKFMAVDFGGLLLLVQYDATLLFEVVVGPDVVVPGKIMDLHAHVGQFRELPQEAGVTARHDVAVLVPEVKHIAQQVDGGSLVLDGIEEAYQTAFLCPLVRYGQ